MNLCSGSLMSLPMNFQRVIRVSVCKISYLRYKSTKETSGKQQQIMIPPGPSRKDQQRAASVLQDESERASFERSSFDCCTARL
mmetsp:Transcript_8527/g.14567  ORF Transcript_8527/g.14567 Transcript_8527/m.14567 type:complete len:84 (+) Transcript_8527:335-586(+)